MSEIKELTNVIVSLRDEMHQRFDAVDQRFNDVEQHFVALEKGIINELRGMYAAMGIPEIHQRLDEDEKRIENALFPNFSYTSPYFFPIYSILFRTALMSFPYRCLSVSVSMSKT